MSLKKDDFMPLPKTATKRQQSKARLLRWQARQAAIKFYGKGAVRGKSVHHRNGNQKDNRPGNLLLEHKSKHGHRHGRGVSSADPLPKKVRTKIRRTKKILFKGI
jgi:hypothetical protein